MLHSISAMGGSQAAAADTELAAGARVGDYVLTAELRGRPGERVFLAHHTVLPRRVRIVVPDDPERALEVARVLETIRHPCVPRLYECGSLPDLRTWFALAIVEGTRLASTVIERPLLVSDAIALIADLSKIVAYAHSFGIVHGDIRADGIAHTTTGWRITDWSEAGVADDPGTDVRAIGVVAYGALARCLPTAPLATRCPDLPEALASMIDEVIADPPPATIVLAEILRISDMLDTTVPRPPLAAADSIETVHPIDPVDHADQAEPAGGAEVARVEIEITEPIAMIEDLDDDPEVESTDVDEPIEIEDIVLVEPPPLPAARRWRPEGGLRPITINGRRRTP